MELAAPRDEIEMSQSRPGSAGDRSPNRFGSLAQNRKVGIVCEEPVASPPGDLAQHFVSRFLTKGYAIFVSLASLMPPHSLYPQPIQGLEPGFTDRFRLLWFQGPGKRF